MVLRCIYFGLYIFFRAAWASSALCLLWDLDNQPWQNSGPVPTNPNGLISSDIAEGSIEWYNSNDILTIDVNMLISFANSGDSYFVISLTTCYDKGWTTVIMKGDGWGPTMWLEYLENDIQHKFGTEQAISQIDDEQYHLLTIVVERVSTDSLHFDVSIDSVQQISFTFRKGMNDEKNIAVSDSHVMAINEFGYSRPVLFWATNITVYLDSFSVSGTPMETGRYGECWQTATQSGAEPVSPQPVTKTCGLSAPPTIPPTTATTERPTSNPTLPPSASPTQSPMTQTPTVSPTAQTWNPTLPTSASPTASPTRSPTTATPTENPTKHPTSHPISPPSSYPSAGPVVNTGAPTTFTESSTTIIPVTATPTEIATTRPPTTDHDPASSLQSTADPDEGKVVTATTESVADKEGDIDAQIKSNDPSMFRLLVIVFGAVIICLCTLLLVACVYLKRKQDVMEDNINVVNAPQVAPVQHRKIAERGNSLLLSKEHELQLAVSPQDDCSEMDMEGRSASNAIASTRGKNSSILARDEFIVEDEEDMQADVLQLTPQGAVPAGGEFIRGQIGTKGE